MHQRTLDKYLRENPGSRFILFFVLILVILGAWKLWAFEIKYKDLFYPGILVGGESVGGQTYAEALNHFREKAGELKQNGLSINFESSGGVRKINIPMSAVGMTPDNSVEYFTLGNWEMDLKSAYDFGRARNILRRPVEQAELLFFKKDFNFSGGIQREAVDSMLEVEAYVYLKKSAPAAFSVVNNKIFISAEKIGERVDREEILNILTQKLAKLDPTPETFVAEADVPEISREKLEPFLNFAEDFAKKTNFIFQHNQHEWKVKGSKLVTWLTINKENQIDIDRAKLEKYFAGTVAKFVDNPPRDSRFEIRNGKLVEVVLGQAGNVVDVDKVVQKIKTIISETSLRPDDSTVYVPIEAVKVEPQVTQETVDKYHIQDLVGEARTSFAGSSADREHNIKIGVATITGMLIPPGMEFSTVSAIGPVSEKEGYVKELVIKKDKTTKEFGGGLCQVATTLFRLALSAGLPITERVNHRFTVHYYDPPGLDATIYGPHPDLRFVNDTGSYLLLQARVENKQVIMELYGRKDGRTVEISKPLVSSPIPAPETKYTLSAELPLGETKCFEAPHDGVTTDVLYTVRYTDGTTQEQNFHSVYQPWQKVCLVGTILPSPVSER